MNTHHQQIHDAYINLFESQHGHLLSLIRVLEKAVNDVAPKLELELELADILQQLQEHYDSEEEMMNLLEYKDIDKHKVEHKDLMLSLRDMETQYKNNKLTLSLLDLIEIIKTRFESHMKKLNRIFEEYHIEHYHFNRKLTESNELSVHVSIFDIQHRNIDFLLDLLQKAIEQDEDVHYISRLIYDFIDKLKIHFVHEEKLMRRYNFPQYEEHFNDHQEFLKLAGEIKHNLEHNKLDISQAEMFEIIQTRVHDHIIKQDKQYGEFFNKLGIL